MSDRDPRTAAEVERDLERRRAELRHTVDEIQDRLSPGELFEQAIRWYRTRPSSQGENRLLRAAVENPIPVLMIGAGVLWLAATAARREDRVRADRPAGRSGPGPLASMGRSRMASGNGPGPAVMGASTLIGDKVTNREGENLGKIEEIMIDMGSGRVAYAVLSFGGMMGMGDKLFAVPWQALVLDPEHKQFKLNVAKERLKEAPGFDKNNWPAMADPTWASATHRFYEVSPYWVAA